MQPALSAGESSGQPLPRAVQSGVESVPGATQNLRRLRGLEALPGDEQ